MKILNLLDIDKSEIKYQIKKFPDGQQDIILEPKKVGEIPFQTNDWSFITYPVQIKSRLNSFQDLELIICATKALNRLKVKEIHLYIPYLLGARSDRQFQDGGTSYIVDVLAPIINSLNFESVTMMDVHSDVSMGLIHNSLNINNVNLLKWALPQIDNKNDAQDNVVLVSPDGGALKKIYETASGAKLYCDIIISAKHRDVKTGKLNGFNVPIIPNHIDKTLVWVDDICDGGGTFIGEAIEANKNGHVGKKYLIVTHGIFSAGFKELTKYFDGIYCTNSYRNIADIENDEVTKTKQLNVF